MKKPLYVIVDKFNNVVDSANTLLDARTRRDNGEDLYIKLSADHKPRY